jgi:4-hydroxybutyrate dehydrogenase / sulfolactaldehyde 3-reductase
MEAVNDALASRFGEATESSHEIMGGSSVRGDIEPGFTIDLAHKDLSIIIAAANAEHVPVPVAAAAREMFSLARASGHGAADFSAIVDSLCDAAGIEKPRVPDDWKHQA